ncbi:MarR family winged helix-turn-helix transcriptional regulator [Jatrophihabitans endophyticus]|uniref:MarR family winged helix-turn-helix transcriptional regulator n=1 Tax=Jatrophihabitans endophyticus TaxID=1206085 RepID=UPI0026EEB7E8|nr:MarR family transcriptional regulator [Jatrophihabitans endophyticus]
MATSRTPHAQDAQDAEDDVVEAVLRASRVLVAVSVRSLSALDDAVTPTQFRTLVVLDGRDSTSLNQLAEALGVNASTAMRTIDRLLAADMVTRAENPDDRRQVLLGLTRRGARLVARVTDHRRKEISRIVAAVPARQRKPLVDALRAFSDAAGEPEVRPETVSVLGW